MRRTEQAPGEARRVLAGQLDSDFTRLAQRLREGRFAVIGFVKARRAGVPQRLPPLRDRRKGGQRRGCRARKRRMKEVDR